MDESLFLVASMGSTTTHLQFIQRVTDRSTDLVLGQSKLFVI